MGYPRAARIDLRRRRDPPRRGEGLECSDDPRARSSLIQRSFGPYISLPLLHRRNTCASFVRLRGPDSLSRGRGVEIAGCQRLLQRPVPPFDHASAHPWNLGLLPRQRGGPAARRGDHRRGFGGAVHPDQRGRGIPGPRRRWGPKGAGIGVDDLDVVGFYDKPILKFERILETYLGVAPRGFRQFLMAGPLWIKEKP